MKTVIQAVWYLDDDNVKHFTVVRNSAELNFLKERFSFVRKVDEKICEA